MRQVLRLLPRQPVRLAQARPPFQSAQRFTTARQLRLKEDVERSPEEVEQAKQEQLKEQQWHKDLASSSEEHVKADQENVEDHDEHMEDLQKQTKQETEKNHPDAKP